MTRYLINRKWESSFPPGILLCEIKWMHMEQMLSLGNSMLFQPWKHTVQNPSVHQSYKGYISYTASKAFPQLKLYSLLGSVGRHKRMMLPASQLHLFPQTTLPRPSLTPSCVAAGMCVLLAWIFGLLQPQEDKLLFLNQNWLALQRRFYEPELVFQGFIVQKLLGILSVITNLESGIHFLKPSAGIWIINSQNFCFLSLGFGQSQPP